MKFLTLLLASGLLVSALPQTDVPAEAQADVPAEAQTDTLAAQADTEAMRSGSFARMEASYQRYVRATLSRRGKNAKCNSNNVILRKEW